MSWYKTRWWLDVRDCASRRNLYFKTSLLALDIFDFSGSTRWVAYRSESAKVSMWKCKSSGHLRLLRLHTVSSMRWQRMPLLMIRIGLCINGSQWEWKWSIVGGDSLNLKFKGDNRFSAETDLPLLSAPRPPRHLLLKSCHWCRHWEGDITIITHRDEDSTIIT